MFIYVFKTFDDREIITETWNEQKANIYKDYINKDDSGPLIYPAKNILIVNTVKDVGEYLLQRSRLSETIFEKLNNGKTIICKGSSENWEGTFILKYYFHQWTDAKGIKRYEGEQKLARRLEFTGPITGDGKVSYEYKGTDGHGGGVTDYYVNKNHRIIGGSSGGNRYYPTENLVYYVTVKLNGKEEKFEVKPVNN